eukprot:scaffold116786_cov40-Tisochrysis_lutea.AAC.1
MPHGPVSKLWRADRRLRRLCFREERQHPLCGLVSPARRSAPRREEWPQVGQVAAVRHLPLEWAFTARLASLVHDWQRGGTPNPTRVGHLPRGLTQRRCA